MRKLNFIIISKFEIWWEWETLYNVFTFDRELKKYFCFHFFNHLKNLVLSLINQLCITKSALLCYNTLYIQADKQISFTIPLQFPQIIFTLFKNLCKLDNQWYIIQGSRMSTSEGIKISWNSKIDYDFCSGIDLRASAPRTRENCSLEHWEPTILNFIISYNIC